MLLPPPRSTLFPYTTLFRSHVGLIDRQQDPVVRRNPVGRLTAGHRKVHADLDQGGGARSEEHTSELQSQSNLVCRLLLEKKTELTPVPAVAAVAVTPAGS